MTIERYIPAPEAVEMLLVTDTTARGDVQDFCYPSVQISVADGQVRVWNSPVNVGDRITRSGSIITVQQLNAYWQFIPFEGPITYGIGAKA